MILAITGFDESDYSFNSLLAIGTHYYLLSRILHDNSPNLGLQFFRSESITNIGPLSIQNQPLK